MNLYQRKLEDHSFDFSDVTTEKRRCNSCSLYRGQEYIGELLIDNCVIQLKNNGDTYLIKSAERDWLLSRRFRRIVTPETHWYDLVEKVR